MISQTEPRRRDTETDGSNACPRRPPAGAVLTGRGITDRNRVLTAATTNVEYTLKVTNTANGESRVLFSPLDTASPAITDSEAFDTRPDRGAPAIQCPHTLGAPPAGG